MVFQQLLFLHDILTINFVNFSYFYFVRGRLRANHFIWDVDIFEVIFACCHSRSRHVMWDIPIFNFILSSF